jgi:uncharacterized cysteine cluster protein YcgN (CxxCxxCC family)
MGFTPGTLVFPKGGRRLSWAQWLQLCVGKPSSGQGALQQLHHQNISEQQLPCSWLDLNEARCRWNTHWGELQIACIRSLQKNQASSLTTQYLDRLGIHCE